MPISKLRALRTMYELVPCALGFIAGLAHVKIVVPVVGSGGLDFVSNASSERGWNAISYLSWRRVANALYKDGIRDV